MSKDITKINLNNNHYYIFDQNLNDSLLSVIKSIENNNNAISDRINDLYKRISELDNLKYQQIIEYLKKLFDEAKVGEVLSKTSDGYKWIKLGENNNENNNENNGENNNENNNENNGENNEESTNKYDLYDILWSDMTVSKEVRLTSDGVIPIGLCVIPTNWLAEGEKARFVSLKYLNGNTPETGKTTTQSLYWGIQIPDSDPLVDYYIPYAIKDEQNNLVDGTTGYYYWDQSICNIKDLRDQNNWKYTYNYAKNGSYAIGDINGKQNTINISVEGNYHSVISFDVKTCVAKFAPQGTKAGDWYIPALGELMQFIFRLRSDQNSTFINNKVKEINAIYPNHCVYEFNYGYSYWSSTVMNNNYVYIGRIDMNLVGCSNTSRNNASYAISYIQL